MIIKEYSGYNEAEILGLYSTVGWCAYTDHPEKLDMIAHHLYGTALTAANFRELQSNFSNYRLWQNTWC